MQTQNVVNPVIVTQTEDLPEIQTNQAGLTAWANTLVIADPAQFEDAAGHLAAIKNWRDRAEAAKEKLYRPIKTALDAVSDQYNPIITELKNADGVVRSKMATYQAAEQAKARAAEAAERKEREEEALRQAKLREAALAAQTAALEAEAAAKAEALRAAGDTTLADAVLNQTAASVAAMAQAHEKATVEHFTAASTAQAVAKTATTAAGAFTTRMVKRFRVVDVNLVPRAFMQVDTAAVQKAIEAGTAVAGIEVYEEAVGAMRRAG